MKPGVGLFFMTQRGQFRATFDTDTIASGHQAIAVVFDLVNPVGAGQRLVGWEWQAGHDEARPVSACPVLCA
jgi:hypothetical protein